MCVCACARARARACMRVRAQIKTTKLDMKASLQPGL